MLDNKNILNKFNDPSLEGEDWLEPSEVVFEKISEELFPEKKEKKFFWIWFGALALLALLLTLGFFYINGQSDFDTNNLNTELAPAVDKKQSNELSSISNKTQPSKSKTTEIISANDAQTNEITGKKISTVSLEESPERPVTSQVTLNNYTPESIHKKNVVSTNETFTSNTNQNINQNINLSSLPVQNPKVGARSLISYLSSLELLNAYLIGDKRIIPNNPNFVIDPISKPIPFEPSTFFHFSSGYDEWKLQLNDNYNTALSPADFRHTEGNGVNLSLGLRKTISSNFFISSDISYSSISFESGHNSMISYNVNDELIMGENQIDVDMATPLGFISSAVIVQRLNSDPTSDTYDLTIDLSNRHRLHALDFNISGNHKLFDFKGFSSYLELGLGVNHLLSLKNELYKVVIDDPSFVTNSNEITMDQGNINKTRVHYLSGILLEKSINESFSLNVSYRFRKDIKSIHTLNDFNTSLSRHGVNMRLVYRL